jgi:hypothetical protein
MSTNKHILGFKKDGLIRFGLKGQCILAQPNGLGPKPPPNLVVLKGQDKERFYIALSERFIKWE